MLQLVQHTRAELISKTDRQAMLGALRDMLSFSGTIIDDMGNSYTSSKHLHEAHHGGSVCNQGAPDLVYAEFKHLRSDTAMVTLRSLPNSRQKKRNDACRMLFILARSEDEWEVMGLPLPHSAANY